MSSLLRFTLLLLQILRCGAASTTPMPTSLPALLTGDCSSGRMTFAYTTTDTSALGSATNLVDGHFTTSFYSTVSPVYTYYSYSTLGCQSQSLSCCPSEAMIGTGTFSPFGTVTTLYSFKPITACPADYSTIVQQFYTYKTGEGVKPVAPTSLCCPSSWKIWPTLFPDNGYTNPCYTPLYNLSVTSAGNQGYLFYTLGSNGQTTGLTDFGISEPTPGEYTLEVMMARSYKLQNVGSGKNKLGTGAIIGIAVPIACLFIGACIFYWVYKHRQSKKAEQTKSAESEKGPGIPELGEGLRHELEPGTKLATHSATEPPEATVVEESHGAKLQGTLQSPWIDGPLHELPAKDIKEMDSNVPAAQEVEADDWRIVPAAHQAK